jgi:hypothetical protein
MGEKWIKGIVSDKPESWFSRAGETFVRVVMSFERPGTGVRGRGFAFLDPV